MQPARLQIAPPGGLAARLGEAMLQFLLPHTCIACEAPVRGPGFCPACWAGLAPITPGLRDRQGLPLAFAGAGGPGSNRVLGESGPRLMAAVAFNEVARRAVHRLKYQDRHEVALPLARLMALGMDEAARAADCIMPVPLHRRRLFARRFNQAALLARPLARRFGLPLVMEALVRRRHTRAQVGLPAGARRRNVADAFAVRPAAGDYLAGRHVLLVDDVITTGATARACAGALLAAGAGRVDVVAFARVVSSDA